jgi:site-specific DNA-methyltransferase (adenine-specific)
MKIITILRKPLDKTIVHNVLTHGCGGLNIDGCRVGSIVQDTSKNGRSSDLHKNTVYKSGLKDNVDGRITVGRWPANFILIEESSVQELDLQSGERDSGGASIFFKQFKKEDNP